MKIAAENIKTYLKFSHQVLGVSHIFQSAQEAIVADSKKIFNLYYWPESKMWKELPQSAPEIHKKSFRNIFVFISEQNQFELRMQENTEMISKMNQALGGADRELLLAWISSNSERDLFEALAQWPSPLKVVLFREDEIAKESLYASGPHTVLETVSPLVDPNDQGRKRTVWNDFKRLLAAK